MILNSEWLSVLFLENNSVNALGFSILIVFTLINKKIHELIELICAGLRLNWIYRQEVLIVLEFKLLVFVHGDFSREVDIPVEVGGDYIQLALFV